VTWLSQLATLASMSEKRVLITGARGFIGRYCLPILREKQFEIHAITSALNPKSDDVQWHHFDLLSDSPTALVEKIRPTHVLHLAWYTEHGRFWTNELNLKWLEASLKLIDAFIESGGKRFVATGTMAEYDWSFGECIENQTPEKPAILYGQTKNKMSKRLFDLAEKNILSTAVGRIFLPYGPGEPTSRLVPSVIKSALEGTPIRCTDATQLRDFLFVRDVAEALIHLLDSSVTGPINIASNKPIQLKEVIEQIRRLTNSDSEIQFGAIARPPNDPDVLTANTKRLNQEVGWTQKVSLEQGLRLCIEHIKSK
jgi:nucleoside-diphosphate-sugar epimerase